MSQVLHSAYILHHYPYQNHGVLLKLFTEQFGLVTAIAKGAKRPRSNWYGLVRPFMLLQLGYSGRGQVKSIKQIESTRVQSQLSQVAMLSGFYINELLLHFLQPEDPHGELFEAYQLCLLALQVPEDIDVALRHFEWRLLNQLGYAPSLQQDHVGQPIDHEQHYQIMPGHLPVVLPINQNNTSQQYAYPGQVLLAISAGQLQDPVVRRYAKYLLRQWLDFYLEGKVLKSRKLLQAFISQSQKKEIIS